MKKIFLLIPLFLVMALAPAWADDAKKEDKKADAPKATVVAGTITLKMGKDGKVEVTKDGRFVGKPQVKVFRIDATKAVNRAQLQKMTDVPLTKLSPEAIQRLRRAHAVRAVAVAKPCPVKGLDAKAVFKAMDKNKDGKVSFKEFEPAFKRVQAMHARKALSVNVCSIGDKPCCPKAKTCPVTRKAGTCPKAKKPCCPKASPCCRKCPCAGKPCPKDCPCLKKPCCDKCVCAKKAACCPKGKTCCPKGKTGEGCKGCPSAGKSGCKGCPNAKSGCVSPGTLVPGLVLPLPDVKTDKKPAKKKSPKVKKPKKKKAPAIPADKMERFKAADKNSDGKLSKDEAPDFMKEKFEAMDKNKDGGLAPQEIHGYFMKMRAAKAKEAAKEKK